MTDAQQDNRFEQHSNPRPGGQRRRAVSPERLLARAGLTSAGAGRSAGRIVAAASRSSLLAMLRRMTEDRLTIIDRDGETYRFGSAPSHQRGVDDSHGRPDLDATIEVVDDRAWTAVATEGSIGFGRGFIEGWWWSDDPTAVVRIIIRNLHGMDRIRNGINRRTGPLTDAIRRALPRSSASRNREDIGAHYDLGNDFFRLFLDDSMTYSAAVFSDPGPGRAVTGSERSDSRALRRDLLAASLAKYDRLLSKIGVAADHQLLEVGTGWGGLAIRAAEQRGASVTTTTVSTEQLDEVRARLALSTAGDRVKLLNRDWRDLEGRFDRIVSIEMIEAVDWRDYDRFFATMERCLAPDGMIGLQAICVPDRRYERTKNTEDFIRRFVFPGGFLPSLGAVARAVGRSTRLQILDVEDFSAHYAETLRLWRHRFDEQLRDVKSLGLDDRFCRLWRFYLAYCEAGFLERHCTVNQIVLVGSDWRPNGLDLRPV